MDFEDLWKRRVTQLEYETGKKLIVRKDAVLALELILSFSKGAEKEIDMEAWKEKTLQWCFDYFGEKNILSARLHMDESRPHIHAIIIPISDKGRLSSKFYTGGKAAMHKMQESYGKEMEKVGLSRGEMYSKPTRKTIKKFYSRLEHAEKSKLPERNPGESDAAYIARMETYLQNIRIDFLWKEQELLRQKNFAWTRYIQLFSRYDDACALMDETEEGLDGYQNARARLKLYRELEQSVPKKEMERVLRSLQEQFPYDGILPDWKQKKKYNPTTKKILTEEDLDYTEEELEELKQHSDTSEEGDDYEETLSNLSLFKDDTDNLPM